MSETTDSLEREAEATRARITETAEVLKGKMTPGQMIDEMTSMFRGGDSEAALGNLKNQVRDNPLPLALVGAGLAWLFLGSGANASPSSRRSSSSSWPTDRPDLHRDPMQRTPSSSSDFSGSSRSSGPGLMERTSNAASGAVDAASGGVSAAAQAVGDASSSVGETLSGAGKAAMDGGSRALHGASGSASRAATMASDLLGRDPLVTAALGLALGVVVGTLLPSTRVEDEQFGEASDAVKDEAQTMATEALDEAKGVAEAGYSAFKDEADRQGIAPDLDKLGESRLGDRVGSAIKEGARAVEDAARDRLGSST